MLLVACYKQQGKKKTPAFSSRRFDILFFTAEGGKIF
jgi:hypothetical protein